MALSKGRPRLCVFVSNRHVYAQIIDDSKGNTLVSVSDHSVGEEGKTVNVAASVGKLLGEMAVKRRIKKVFLDRGAKQYHSRVKALAEAARKAGLEF